MGKTAKKYLTYVAIKLKNDAPLQILYHLLNAAGIRIQPFFVTQEALFGNTNPFFKPCFRQYTVSFFDADDIRDIARFPDRNTSEKEMLKWLAAGCLCIGLKDKGRIAAFTWCDLNWCHFPGYRFQLKTDEAYLFDAHTAVEHRGRGLAPFVRYRLYEELALLGRVRLYSITERFNDPAIRFKQKLNGTTVDKGVYFEMFGRWSLRRPARTHVKSGNVK